MTALLAVPLALRTQAQQRRIMELSDEVDAETHPKRRKKKKRRKRKLPKGGCRLFPPGCGRLCDLQRQVPPVQVVHVLEGAPASVHRQSVGPPRCATETWYPQCELCRRPARFHRYSSSAKSFRLCCATTDAWFDGAANCGVSAEAVHRRSSTSLSFRRGRSPWSRLLGRPQRFPVAVRCQVVDAPAEQVVPCPLLSTTGAYGQTVQKTAVSPQLQFVDEVVDISVVVQRQFPMVLFRTMEILQLQYTDKVIDVPVVPVLFPSAGVEKTAELPRSSWTRWLTCPCVHRQVPMTQSTRLWTSLCSCSDKFPAVPGGASELFIDKMFKF